MTLRNLDRWGPASQALHWLIALLVLVMAGIGLALDELPRSPKWIWVYDLHKSIGLSVLALAVVRLAWRLVAGAPPPVPGLPRAQRLAAGVTHWLLYLLIFLMPLSGWLYDSASGLRPLRWFGQFAVPRLVAPDEGLADDLHDLHETLFLVLVVVVAAHVLAALWHHLFRGDATLARMLPKGWLVVVLALGLAPGTVRAADYVQAPGSTLAFAGEYDGATFTGTFPGFDTRLSFDPAKPGEARLEVVVPLARVETGSRERDETLVTPDFFSVAQHPTARYTATGFEPVGDGRYVARGTLELRGTSAPVTLRLEWHPGERPVLEARASVSRTRFGVGGGDWADTSLLPDAIAVSARVVFGPG